MGNQSVVCCSSRCSRLGSNVLGWSRQNLEGRQTTASSKARRGGSSSDLEKANGTVKYFADHSEVEESLDFEGLERGDKTARNMPLFGARERLSSTEDTSSRCNNHYYLGSSSCQEQNTLQVDNNNECRDSFGGRSTVQFSEKDFFLDEADKSILSMKMMLSEIQ